MTKKHGKCYIGAVVLYSKGKPYGGTTRQVCASTKSGAKKKLIDKFRYRGNKVKVTKLTLRKDWK